MIIKSKLVPKGICVNLFGSFWARDTSWIDEKVINHECVHTAQQRELLFVPFYLLYLAEWAVRFIQHRDWRKAYYAISFEREAYAYGGDLRYHKSRKRYNWLNYLK
ncbi:hypothetical protein [uncultured Duncaniella sp.]|uniref:hypothetical protein n=1 Tax=uncultured Duncaniella sp. TaxID=2768039 RepID=UPI0026764FAA|nr:hypothetical protein [uncultured Duncaniella sp.]